MSEVSDSQLTVRVSCRNCSNFNMCESTQVEMDSAYISNIIGFLLPTDDLMIIGNCEQVNELAALCFSREDHRYAKLLAVTGLEIVPVFIAPVQSE